MLYSSHDGVYQIVKETVNLTSEDLGKISHVVETVVQPMKEDLSVLKDGVNVLVTHVDEFVTMNRRYDDELVVLRAQQTKMRDVLVKKGVATESELSIA